MVRWTTKEENGLKISRTTLDQERKRERKKERMQKRDRKIEGESKREGMEKGQGTGHTDFWCINFLRLFSLSFSFLLSISLSFSFFLSISLVFFLPPLSILDSYDFSRQQKVQTLRISWIVLEIKCSTSNVWIEKERKRRNRNKKGKEKNKKGEGAEGEKDPLSFVTVSHSESTLFLCSSISFSLTLFPSSFLDLFSMENQKVVFFTFDQGEWMKENVHPSPLLRKKNFSPRSNHFC